MTDKYIGEMCFEMAKLAASGKRNVLSYMLLMAAEESGSPRAPLAAKDLQPRLGLWEWDVSHNKNYCDATLAEMFGVDPRKAAKGLGNDEYCKAVHPDDIDQVTRALNASIKSGSDFVAEYRVTTNGRISWLFARGKVFLDRSRRPVRFPGAIVDVTHLHQLAA